MDKSISVFDAQAMKIVYQVLLPPLHSAFHPSGTGGGGPLIGRGGGPEVMAKLIDCV